MRYTLPTNPSSSGNVADDQAVNAEVERRVNERLNQLTQLLQSPPPITPIDRLRAALDTSPEDLIIPATARSQDLQQFQSVPQPKHVTNYDQLIPRVVCQKFRQNEPVFKNNFEIYE